MKIAIAVPAYNEEKEIEKVIQELLKLKLPIFVIDDGSKDSTYAILQKYNLHLLQHRINLGKGAALKTVCDAIFTHGFDALVMIDADGQHKVEDLPKFITALESGCQMVFGMRNSGLGVPLIRFMGNKLASIFVSCLFGIYVSDLICGYRAFTKKAYQKITWESSQYGVETEMVINTGQSGLKYCEVPVQTVYYDNFKGVTVLDALGILFDVIKWRISK